MTFDDCKKIAVAQVAADYGIDVSAFDGGVHVFTARKFGSRALKTKTGKPFLDMIYFGDGLVAVADESIIRYVEEYLSRCGKDAFRAFDAPDIFELNELALRRGYTVGEMAQGFLPTEIFPLSDGDGAFLTLYDRDINELYAYKEFTEALCYSTTAPRRDVIAVAYRVDDRPVAVAACSNDGEKMYQIGVDVLPEYRRRGLATSLVKRLTSIIIDKGKCPYYRCAWSNIPSRRTALACRYADAWVELFFRPIK